MKENPYFKFYTSEWMNGRITLEDLEIQGLFINICAYYWHHSGNVTKTDIIKRFKNPVGLDSLLSENLIGLIGDKLEIKFLDEQLKGRGVKSVVNQANGKLGGRPKKTQSVNFENPNKSNIDKIREDNSNNNSNKDNKNKAFSKPTIQEVNDYFILKMGLVGEKESIKFFSYYESNGWKVGKNTMKNWQAAATGWISRSEPKKPEFTQEAKSDY